MHANYTVPRTYAECLDTLSGLKNDLQILARSSRSKYEEIIPEMLQLRVACNQIDDKTRQLTGGHRLQLSKVLAGVLRDPTLPKASDVQTHSDVIKLLGHVSAHFPKELRTALDQHPDLITALEILQKSAHEEHAPLSDGINESDARHIMIRDVISAVQTGELSIVGLPQSAEAAEGTEA